MTMGYKKIVLLKDTGSTGRTKEFYNLFLEQCRLENLQDDVQIVRVADIGMYDKGIVVRIIPGDITYAGVTEAHIQKIIQQTLKNNKPVKELLFTRASKQMRVVLKSCGEIDPENIKDYIACDGYQALKTMLAKSSSEDVINELKTSGLRGRGGGGFPTWMKWKFARQIEADQKYIICNADEGDPGAYMDRSVLEGDPHSVVEGMIIAGYAVGATKGFVYVRAEYELAIERVEKTIEQAREYGLLGEHILGSDFSFDLEIRLGAGAFVCGEETALIASIEGKRGYPSPRPPYPSVKGLWGKPTVINNVETLATVPVILRKGGAWFASIGSENAKGTKVFALTGKVKNSGLIEVPMGITLREIVFDIGGGMLNGKKIKAVQTGGPSGGVIPEHLLDTPVDYENLQKLGSIMGSGGMIVMDEDDCMVDIAKFYLKFCVDESCGKCAPCRIGGFQMLGYLNKISEGKAGEDDIELLERICNASKKASLCGLGQTSPNPVLSTLKYFREEYLEHIRDRKCRARKCVDLLTYHIGQEKCKRCSICMRNCPVNAISGDKQQGFLIDVNKCVKCGKCFDVCKFDAIIRE
ncbi:MAG: NADH-ubiquinone oxidoreductase-F iron-sulfur binding region domain-containing protein [Candidatus Omnitrophica bacterium]|nr:NADH-ubiquinone oxidoreductase-F iron-sulfur binding region domain-containing protein [Candidatus Omnitrophota bacterium]